MTVKLHSIRNAAALAAVASALCAAPAAADNLAASTGSFSTPPLPGVGDVTLQLGPLGARSVDGIKNLKVTVSWDNLAGQITHVAGTACQVQQSLIANIGTRLDMSIAYSYTRDRPAPQKDQLVSQTVQLLDQTVQGEDWNFGVCYDSVG